MTVLQPLLARRGNLLARERLRGLTVLFTLAISIVWTATGRCEWQTFGTNDGLANGYVLTIAEDHSGNLWFGSAGSGVSRFDGFGWTTLTRTDGLVHDYVQAVLEDRSGVLWFGTQNGVSRYDGASWQTYLQAPNIYVSDILQDHLGNLWFATHTSGVTRFDGTTWKTFTIADGLASNAVRCILEDAAGNLWFGTETGGASRYDGANWTKFNAANGLPSNYVTGIHETRDGILWFATFGGVGRFDGVGWTSYTTANGLANNQVRGLAEDRSGNLWFATFGGGASRFDGTHWRTYTTAEGLANNSLLSIHVDRMGALWFGTWGQGANRYDEVSLNTFRASDGLGSSIAMSVLQDRVGRIWAGTSAGVSSFDGTTWTTNPLPGFSNAVFDLLEDRAGNIWLATKHGVYEFDGTSLRNLRVADGLASDTVRALRQDHAGNLWFGTTRGASRFDGANWTTFHQADGLANDAVEAIFEDDSGRLWFGTRNGLSRYDGAVWTTITTADGLANDYVNDILEARDGTLWFGTGNGVSRFTGTRWDTYRALDGLGNDVVHAVRQDSLGNLWFGTQGGAVRFDGANWGRYTSGEGMGSDIVLGITINARGQLWCATDQGVTRLEPDLIPPQTVITPRLPALSANNIQIISFVAAFKEVSDIQYSYSFEGSAWSRWSPTSSWLGKLLPDGTHVFEVKARDLIGNVDPTPAVFQFEIDATPPSPSILVPGPNASVHGSVTIDGTAADARFANYHLDYRASGATGWTPLADTMRVPVTDGTLGGWNTRGLSDGKYELKLSVADTLGLVGTLVIPVSVDNQFPYAGQTSPALVTAADGGNVYTDDAGAHLYIPPHGLSRDTIVTVTALDTVAVPGVLPGGAVRVSAGVQLGWGTVVLEKTATLDLAGAGLGAPVVYFEGAGSTWRRLGGTVNAASNRVSVPVNAPGRYALFAGGGEGAGVESSTVTTLTLTPRVFGPRGGYANAEVAIGFTLGRAGSVTVRVFSRSGRLIREVARNQSMGPGANMVRWDGRDRGGSAVDDGLYLVTVDALGSQRTRTLAVVR